MYILLCNFYFRAAWGATPPPIPTHTHTHASQILTRFTGRQSAHHKITAEECFPNPLPCLLSPGCFRPRWSSRTSAGGSWRLWSEETGAHKSGAISWISSVNHSWEPSEKVAMSFNRWGSQVWTRGVWHLPQSPWTESTIHQFHSVYISELIWGGVQEPERRDTVRFLIKWKRMSSEVGGPADWVEAG